MKNRKHNLSQNGIVLMFFLLSIGFNQGIAQPFAYWPDYNQTPIAEISQETWINTDHVVSGWDWSMPAWLIPASSSKLVLARNADLGTNRINNLPEVNFPANPVMTHWINWKAIEPSEDSYKWEQLIANINSCSAKGYKSIIRFMTCQVDRSVPAWLNALNLPTRDDGLNLDPADPTFHSKYLDFVADFGASGIPAMDDVVGLYVGYASTSWGDEGIGPVKGESDPSSNDAVPHVRERLEAWAAITTGMRHKMIMGGYSDYGFSLGFGIRRGFVEHYMYHTPDPVMGQLLSSEKYMYVDETNPIIANNLYNGEENEEYEDSWVDRFGPTNGYPYRYFSSNLRLLQMRCNASLFNGFSLMPEMFAWLSLELGRSRTDAPDAWCFLRETYIRNGVNANVKNFERWIYQRDSPGYETEAVIPIDKNYSSWMYSDSYPYDYIARKGKKIGFAADDVVFPTDIEHNVAIKISFWDGVAGTLKLVYHDDSGPHEKSIVASGTDAIKTATFFLTAKFDAAGFNYDFELHSEEEVPVSFVRVVKNESNSVAVSGVTVSPGSLNLKVGTSGVLKETVFPVDAYNKAVSWSSSNAGIASVNSNGLVSALSVGSATITVTTNDGGFSALSEITVNPIAVSGVTVSPVSLILEAGETGALSETIDPSNASDKSVTWSTSDESVATVNTSGIVSAVSPGSASITVTTNDGNLSAVCAVTVNPIAVRGITISPTSLTLDLGSTSVLTESVTPSDAADKTVTWSSSNERIATVDASGLVTAIAEGSAFVTVTTTSGGFKDSCEITVNDPNSVALVQELQLSIFPNPLSKGLLTVSSNINIEEIRVFDLSGTLRYREEKCFGGSVKINLDHLQSGMYFIQIETKQSSSFEKVLIR